MIERDARAHPEQLRRELATVAKQLDQDLVERRRHARRLKSKGRAGRNPA
jgi:hypothetical protein